jgi:excisionase family DNA binding protein
LTDVDRLLTAGEVAELLAVPATWPLEQARAGHIPHVRLGRYVRFRREAVLAWVDGLEQGGGQASYRKHRPTVGRAG